MKTFRTTIYILSDINTCARFQADEGLTLNVLGDDTAPFMLALSVI